VSNPVIVVATLGRVLEAVDRGYIELGCLEVCVIDEADKYKLG